MASHRRRMRAHGGLLVACLLAAVAWPAQGTPTRPSAALPDAVLAPTPGPGTRPAPADHRPRSPAAATPQPRTAAALTEASEYLDTCGDVSGDTLDVRRATVGADGDILEIAVGFCGLLSGDDLELGSRALVVRTRASGPGTARQVEVVESGGDIQVRVRDGESGVLLAGPPTTEGFVRTSGPSPRLVARVPSELLAVNTCGSGPPTGCLGLRYESYPSTGPDPGDLLPNEPPSGHEIPSIVWPSRCQPALGVSARADARVVEVAPERQDDVEAALQDAGHPTAVLSPGRIEVQAGATAATDDALRTLAGVRDVRAAPARTRAATPDDPRFDEQWALPRLRIPDAWDTTTGSSDVRIAIVDDGIDGQRPDLLQAGSSDSRTMAGYDALAYTEDNGGATIPAGADSDLGGHGTAVTGVVAATGDDGRTIAGVDWQASLVPVRVFDHEGCFVSIEAYLDALAHLADLAEDGGVDIVNLSLGGQEIPEESALVRRIVAGGAVVVAATGNEGDVNGVAASFPAALPEVVAVGAIRRDDTIAGYSNRGRHVDVVAPGGDQSSTATGDVLALSDPTLTGRHVQPIAGTSFSTPLVSGLASLYLAAHPTATPADVVRALLATSDDLGAGLAGHDPAYGFGAPDAAEMLAEPTGQLARRLSGANRYATAAATSRRAFPDPSLVDVVLLATGTTHPDALAGGPLAARAHAPLLLTLPDQLPGDTAAELQRLAPSRVVLLGGESAIAASVADVLTGAGIAVDRVAGADRYDTAAQVAVGRSDGTATWPAWGTSDVVVIATGEAFPDALAGGATAAAAGAPLLLTRPDTLPDVTAAALDRLSPSVVIVLGGPAAVSQHVLGQIEGRASSPRVVRASGANRYETAARAVCPDQAVCIQDTRYALVATGETFADALGGSAAAAALRAPLLLVPPDGTLPDEVRARLSSLEPEQVLVLGGPAAVSDAVLGETARITVR